MQRQNLFFTNEVEKILPMQIYFYICQYTTKPGIGAGQASDLRWVEVCARQVALFAKGHTIVVEKSTLPVKTAEVIKKILEASQEEKCDDKNPTTFDVLSNPEFLSEGSAVKDLLNPDRVLIGGENIQAINSLIEIYKCWVPEEKILHTNIWSSELAKLTANAFLAQRISSINSIAALCEATGADVREVARAIGSDSRIGPHFDSGPGFGGCFKRYLESRISFKFLWIKRVANFWESVVHLNKWHSIESLKLLSKAWYFPGENCYFRICF